VTDILILYVLHQYIHVAKHLAPMLWCCIHKNIHKTVKFTGCFGSSPTGVTVLVHQYIGPALPVAPLILLQAYGQN
jgi:hypothetical protein